MASTRPFTGSSNASQEQRGRDKASLLPPEKTVLISFGMVLKIKYLLKINATSQKPPRTAAIGVNFGPLEAMLLGPSMDLGLEMLEFIRLEPLWWPCVSFSVPWMFPLACSWTDSLGVASTSQVLFESGKRAV